ncbi:MAG TPA: tetratricopeptide repeat protein, partial [Myxococcales bacterium]|nr:tetratricopeptide repeat protein [Myxococcales bacterium]
VASLFPPTAASEVRAGAQLARQGDVDGALAHFRRATELDPGSAPAWRNLGVAYAHKGDQVRSLQAYRTYLKLESDGEQARAVRALLGEK